MTPQYAVHFACLALLAGCRVPLPAPAPNAYAPVANSKTDIYKEANGWHPSQPSESIARGPWWEIFGDPQLNTLEQQIEVSNQDLKEAEARFREARAVVCFNRATEFPVISTASSISSLRASNNAPYRNSENKPTGDYTLAFDLSYEIDLWGSVRRQVRASREEAQAVAADLESVRLTLHAELAHDYFELRGADAQKHLLDQTVESYRETQELTSTRFEEGAVPKSDVMQAKSQLEIASVADTDIAIERAQYEHAIAVLLGKPPVEFNIPEAALPPTVPEVPIALPSQLLERRPDIAAAERRVAEANDQIGIARMAFYPTVSLEAAAGLEGDSAASWFVWPSRFWSVGPSLAEALFDAGRRRATSNAAVASYDATVAAYRQTVLNAFQQVENNLAALRILEHEARQQSEATASARESLELVTNRYREGADPYLQVLTAQTITLMNERNDIDIQRRRLEACVLLVKALGGTWSAASLPTAHDLSWNRTQTRSLQTFHFPHETRNILSANTGRHRAGTVVHLSSAHRVT